MDFETKNCRKCGEKLDSRLFACREHWMELPENIREGIRDSYIKADYEMYRLMSFSAVEFWNKDA